MRLGRLWPGRSVGFSVCVLEFVLSVLCLEEGPRVWVIDGQGPSQACEEAAPSVTREAAPRGRPRQRRGPGSAASLHPAMGQPGADGWASGASVGLSLPAGGAPCPGGAASAVSSARPPSPVAVLPASGRRDRVERPATCWLERAVVVVEGVV